MAIQNGPGVGEGTLQPVLAMVDAPVAEPGSTTSELRVLIGAAIANTIDLALAFGAPLTQKQVTALEVFAGTVTLLASIYIGGRSIRKMGTTA